MSGRDLVVLGTASQAPTRDRNHNGYLLRWDRDAFLFDPGEGTQRQLLHAGVPASHITRILLTHLHGDHCLGLPGVLQRMSLDNVGHEVPITFPASGLRFVEHLCHASSGRRHLSVRFDPIEAPTGEVVIAVAPPLRITARRLAHGIDALGYRIEEPTRPHLLTDRLRAFGIDGPAAGEILVAGSLEVGGRVVLLEEVSEVRPGHAVAIVLDTGVCDAAVALAAGVDLLLCEATFLEAEADIAAMSGHLTARQAATIAREAGAKQLVLTHFSSRYPTAEDHVREAAAVFPDVVAAADLDVIPLPSRPV